jgi:tRNA A37 threonylcarbamoyladenosine synthetase subunit TsaC/SUA5/YrdC
MVSEGLSRKPVGRAPTAAGLLTTVKVTNASLHEAPMPVREAADLVVDVIKGGGLALVPFGVAYAFVTGSRAPLGRIYELKLRPPEKACPILVSWEDFVDAADAKPEQIERIGRVVSADLPVGVLVEPRWDSAMARSIPDDCRELLTSNGKLGLFMNMGGMSGQLLDAAAREDVRLFGSSANFSGMGNSFSLEDVPESIVGAMDIVCEAGTCTYANPDRLPSSIVDLETGQLTRRGILHEEIGRLLDG